MRKQQKTTLTWIGLIIGIFLIAKFAGLFSVFPNAISTVKVDTSNPSVFDGKFIYIHGESFPNAFGNDDGLFANPSVYNFRLENPANAGGIQLPYNLQQMLENRGGSLNGIVWNTVYGSAGFYTSKFDSMKVYFNDVDITDRVDVSGMTSAGQEFSISNFPHTQNPATLKFDAKIRVTCAVGEEVCYGENLYKCEMVTEPTYHYIYDFTNLNMLHLNDKGKVEGKCGYTTQITTPKCKDGDEICDGKNTLICLNNDYTSKGLVDGKCGYNTPVNPDSPDNIPYLEIGIFVGLLEVLLVVYLRRKR